MLLTKIKKHLHRGSLHTTALLLAALSFLSANEAAIEAMHNDKREMVAIVPLIAEREVVHPHMFLGGSKSPEISGN